MAYILILFILLLVVDNIIKVIHGKKRYKSFSTEEEKIGSFDKLAKKNSNESSRGEVINGYYFLRDKELVHGQDEFEMRNKSFDKEVFFRKVEIAFKMIYETLEEKDLNYIKKFASHSLLKRYESQIEMMKKVKANYNFSNLIIEKIVIDEYECEPDYDIIHVGVMARVEVNYYSIANPILNYSDREKFVEYLSFMRKRGSKDGDIYTNNNCPNCASPLDNQNDISKCSYCYSIITSGEYDWILAEVTQGDDYLYNRSAKRDFRIYNKLDKLSSINNDFSVQKIEDKVSNGYIQILYALANNNLTLIKKFVDKSLYEKLLLKEKDFLYIKFFINHLTLIDLFEKDLYNYLDLKVKISYQRAKFIDDKLEFIDETLNKKMEVIRVMRKQNSFIPKGELYSHTCPSCGGVIPSTSSTHCSYCHIELSNPEHEWIIVDIIPWMEYSLSRKK